MRKKIKVNGYQQCSDRIIWLRIESKLTETFIIQVYMPTSIYENDEVEHVYEEEGEVFKGTDNLILMVDWNAVVGEEKEGNIVGKYGLGK